MKQILKFEAKESNSKIEEIFEIDSNTPTKTQLINIFIHLELFFDKMFYPSHEVHKTYLNMLDAFGLLQDYIKNKSKTPNLSALEDFEIEDYEKFINKMNTDKSFSLFIYDFLKEKL